MDKSRYRVMTEQQLADLVRGLPRREPPPALRDRVLAQARPRRASLLRPQFAFAVLLLLLLLDAAVLRWQNTDRGAVPAPHTVVTQTRARPDDDLLLLAQETCGGLWSRALVTPPAPAETYLQLREQLLKTMERG